MNNLTMRMSGVLLAGLLAIGAAGCGAANNQSQGPAAGSSGTVTASGSTALLPLATVAKDEFEAKHSDVTINVSSGGSFNGLTQVASGAVNIGMSDVEATGDTGKGLVDHKVAVAPFMIIINKDVTTQDVTMEQLAKIFRGEITNWKDVGGKEGKITIVSRQQSSGSRATIVASVLNGQGDISKDAVVQDSNGKVLDSVTSTPGGIGYVDAPYFKADKVGALKIGGTAYSPEAVTGGKWPIYAFEHMYTKGEPTGAVKAFLDFIMSNEFQDNVVAKQGFVPISKMAK